MNKKTLALSIALMISAPLFFSTNAATVDDAYIKVTGPNTATVTGNAEGGVAIGNAAQAEGYSTALGSYAAASNGGVAIGTGNVENKVSATAKGATAVGGAGTNATGRNASAFGTGSQATGNNSLALGTSSSAIGSTSIASGNSSKAYGSSSVAIGNGAVTGSSDSTINGGTAIAIGNNASAVGQSSIASGSTAKAYSNTSIAIGVGTTTGTATDTASGVNSVAIGTGASATTSSSIALGSGASATTSNSVALGSGAKTTAEVKVTAATIGNHKYTFANGLVVGTVSFGDSTGSYPMTRQLTNVSAGQLTASSTDAVNGSQLYAATQEIAINSTDIANLKNQTNNFDSRISKNEDNIKSVGSLSAALAGLKPIQYDPMMPTQIMAALGTYDGSQSVALGVGRYTNESTLIHGGLAFGGSGDNHFMANVGVTVKVGSHGQNVPERYKAGPISSIYVMQDEMAKMNAVLQQVIAENNEMRQSIH